MATKTIGKKWCAAVLCAAMLMGITGCSETKTQETVAGEEYIYAQITAINGNEITYAVAELVDTSAEKESEASGESNVVEETGGEGETNSADEAGQNGQSQPSGSWDGSFPGGNFPGGNGEGGSFPGGNFPGGNGEGGSFPGGSFPGGNGEGMPDFSDMEGMTMPDMENMEGFTMPDMENMEGFTMPDFGNMEGMTRPDRGEQEGSQGGNQGGSQSMYTLTGESVTTMIPVGTVVTTQLGTETTFSRLAVGDMLRIKLTTNDAGEQVILAIWIVG